jgi:hypothetical protein
VIVRRRASALALTLAATAAAATAAAGPASASQQPPLASCLPKRAKSLAVNTLARVYRSAAKGREPITGFVYGCYRPEGKRYRLVTESDDNVETLTKLAAVKLSGRYAAYVVTSEDLSCKDACPPGFEAVRDVVRVADLQARTSRALDTGLIDAKSLKVTSTTVTWKDKNGTTKSAPLAKPASGASACAVRGSTTNAANDDARVYTVTGSDGEGTLFGCWNATGRSVTLARLFEGVDSSGEVSQLQLSGGFVAYVYTTTDLSCRADCPPGFQPTKSRLAAANLKAGTLRVLSTAAIDAGSLKLAGSTASWTEGGAAKSVTLG